MENKLSTLSLEELELRKKKYTSVAYGLGSIFLIAFFAIIFLAIKSGNMALIVVAMGCSVAYLPMIVNLNQINKEIKSRKPKTD